MSLANSSSQGNEANNARQAEKDKERHLRDVAFHPNLIRAEECKHHSIMLTSYPTSSLVSISSQNAGGQNIEKRYAILNCKSTKWLHFVN